MDDLQLNISVAKKKTKKVEAPQKAGDGYKFASKPNFGGKIIARKRPQTAGKITFNERRFDEPQKKVPKLSNQSSNVQNNNAKAEDLASKLRDLSENKGKFLGKDYQQVTDDLQLKQKPRSGAWISSLFKNNPEVPRMGQRAVKPVVEKVFAGRTFADLDIHPHSVANLQQNLNLTELMTVQQKAIPVILQGRDVLIRSQTGSGKTLAYALPVIEALQAIRPKVNRHDGIRVVVVVPTRELAVQTYELFVKLTKPFIWIVPGLLSGGQKRKAEKARLRKGLSVLVGTPGRINDHLRHTHSLNFAKTGVLILDEADRLLDMGYEKDVAAIVKAIEDHKKAATYDPIALVKQTITKHNGKEDESNDQSVEIDSEQSTVKHHLTEVLLSTERQTILLSATLTKAVENLAGITMKEPVFVDTAEGKAVVADSLKPKEVEKTRKGIKLEENVKEDIKESDVNVHAVKNITEVSPNDHKKLDTDFEHNTSKRGLKAFNGSIHLDLFGNNGDNSKKVVNNDSTTKKITKQSRSTNKNDSDSDSDYEYFKVQKELEAKKQVDKTETKDEDTKNEVALNTGNTFVEALQTAIKEDELVLPATVNQTFLVVPMKLRLVTLCSLIVEHCVLNKKGGKMIVFMATLEMVDYHADLLETVLSGKEDKKKDPSKKFKRKKKKLAGDEDDSGSSDESEYEMDYQMPEEGSLVPVDIDVFSLHGSMPHERRMEVFKQFRQAKRGLLICTDVAARGIDVPRVDLVLQYCAPASVTDYVHRVGRTGRAAQVGAAVLFLLPSEAEFVRHLEQKRIRLRQSDETKALEALRTCAWTQKKTGNRTQKVLYDLLRLRQSDETKALEALRTVAPSAPTVQRAAIAVQARLEHVTHSSRDWLAKASRAYTSWVRFYSGYPRDVRMWLDARQLHLGHAAKSFALRDTPGALAKRAKADPNLKKEKPHNRLTLREEEEMKRPGFPKVKIGAFGARVVNKQSSMHTASEFDSGLPPVDTYNREMRNKKKKTK